MYDNLCSLYYQPKENRFIDEGGYVIYNVFSIVSPNMIYLFKTKKEDMLVYGVDGTMIELIYDI